MPELKDKFEIKCKQCGSDNVNYYTGEDLAYQDIVMIVCEDCKNGFQLL